MAHWVTLLPRCDRIPDFRKDAQSRKVRDDIIPGEPRKTIPYRLTLEAIQRYCRAVGEDHPLYFDEAYARTTRYGGLIAPPLFKNLASELTLPRIG